LRKAPDKRFKDSKDIAENGNDKIQANNFMLKGNRGKNAAECSNM